MNTVTKEESDKATDPDIATFAPAYGSIQTDANYNIICDFDADGDVDGGDLAEFASKF